MRKLRPADLAREHGISTQAVRNYERDGFLPPAERTDTGYRVYTPAHAAALRAFYAFIPALGHATAGQIMRAVNQGRLDQTLMIIHSGHQQLLSDRATLDSVRTATAHLTAQTEPAPIPGATSITVGELAHLLGLTQATVRNWEEVGILSPARDPATGYRRYRAEDVRDAQLAHLLRRGGYLLPHIAAVVQQIRTAGGTESLAEALTDWQDKLTAQGLALLEAAAQLNHYLGLRRGG